MPPIRFSLSALILRKASSVFLLCAATVIASPAQTFKNLTNFNAANGAGPYYMTLVQGTDGNLYGTTNGGGTNDDGTVFKITPSGKLTSLLSFDNSDGSNPVAGLALDLSGNFYGTASGGGASTYYGTIFKMTPTGKLTTVYNVCSEQGCHDGADPYSALVQDVNGNFYGTTNQGGDQGQGTVYKVTAGGKFTRLHTFAYAEGVAPWAGLVQASNGDFYGTTSAGTNSMEGSVFKITSQGKFTVVYTFCSKASCSDGATPRGTLVQAPNGDLYGTTPGGGDYNGGTVFKLTPGGKLTTLYSFCAQSNCPDGYGPYAGLVLGTDGNFYGTTVEGGVATCDSPYGCGTVFKITPQGKLTTLHRFKETDGALPFGGLVQATNGSFYGTTTAGGPTNVGTIFSLSMGLNPFVAFVRASGKVGQTVGILGQGLTGTTGVYFNGTSAQFKVVSATFLTATVPAGASSGVVTVKAPGGKLTSNQPFRIMP